jgi:hypothetical protein
MPDMSRNQAVVLGASMAGSLAARVLAERFEQVVVIERDALPLAGEHRRGVPHGLHPRGREIPGGLFPGFTASLTASGAVRGDLLGMRAGSCPATSCGRRTSAFPACSPAGRSWKATSGRWFKRRCAWSTPTCHGCTPPLPRPGAGGSAGPGHRAQGPRGRAAPPGPHAAGPARQPGQRAAIAPPADPAPAATPAGRPAQPAQ